MTIEDRVAALLEKHGEGAAPRLKKLLAEQTRIGVAKYGQRLEDNAKPRAAKAAHATQEGMDLLQYLEWLLEDEPRPGVRWVLESFQEEAVRMMAYLVLNYGLHVNDLTFKEGHS